MLNKPFLSTLYGRRHPTLNGVKIQARKFLVIQKVLFEGISGVGIQPATNRLKSQALDTHNFWES